MRLLAILTRVPVRFYCDLRVPQALRSLKGKSRRNTVQYYVDSCVIRAEAGRGGDGSISFLSSWCKEHAGPDGGDGGNGGHVLFQASSKVRSLNHCKPVARAAPGERGGNKDCHGKSGEHVVVEVPIGTLVRSGCGPLRAELGREGQAYVAARGGGGGRGNRFFATDTEQAPEVAEKGAEGESLSYSLELQTMAHIGLIGFPNAGKSSLLRAMSRARPRVAPHPFTTTKPHVGMVQYDDYVQVGVADLPGIVEGAHRNRGLGIEFLRHASRCVGLLYVVDGDAERPEEQYDTLHREVQLYSTGLSMRPSQLILNKVDLERGRDNYQRIQEEGKYMLTPISAKTGEGLTQVLAIIRQMYDHYNAKMKMYGNEQE